MGVEAMIANTPIFEEVVLAFYFCIMKVSSSSDMFVIWIDIWDSQKKTKGKTLINCLFNLRYHIAIVWKTTMYSEIAQYCNY